MKQIKNILRWILAILVFPWFYFTRQAFYVTGTFRDKNGERMFFKTTFVTHSYIFPIKSLEDSLHEQMNGERPIILFFQRIPYRMLEYIEADYSQKIKIERKFPKQ